MRPIQLDKPTQNKLIKQLLEMCKTQNLDSTFKVSLSLDTPVPEFEKPLVRFTPLAYLKMMQLVKACTTEIAWHGSVQRVAEREFLITDILCYPQKATGATVEADETDGAYGQWMMGLSEETHNSLRFQGHSHVNMAVSPSGTDLADWDAALQFIPKDSFYIFAIINKSASMHFRIFDKLNNVTYSSTEINVEVDADDDCSIEAWAQDCLTQYMRKPVVAAAQTTISTFGSPAASYGYHPSAAAAATSAQAKANADAELARRNQEETDNWYRNYMRERGSYDEYDASEEGYRAAVAEAKAPSATGQRRGPGRPPKNKKGK